MSPGRASECRPPRYDEVFYQGFRVGALARKTSLPVAALPQYPGEVWTVHRAKVRPCLVLAVAGSDVPKALAGSWQTKPAFLVAPAYVFGGLPPESLLYVARETLLANLDDASQ